MSRSRTAIFVKAGALAVLTLETESRGAGRVSRFDPRQPSPLAKGHWDFTDKAQDAFEHCKRISGGQGWQIAYEGPPLRG